jgi:hypothetical protein
MAGDLYIKYQNGDDGTRPINPCTNFWASPSVWLSDSNGNGINEAKVGSDNIINVQVDSKSATAKSGVKVQVWVCDFTLGGVGPAAALISGSSGGPAGRTGSVSTGVSSNAPGIAQVHWTPIDDPAHGISDLINSPEPNKGHVCVGANVYVEGTAPEGTIKTSGLLDVCNDQHHAWKNITVVKTIGLRLVEFSFRVVNPSQEVEEFALAVAELDRELAMGQLEQEQLLTAGFVDLRGGKDPNGDGDGDGDIRPECLDEPLERKRLREGGELVLTGLEEPIPLRPAKDPARAVDVVAEEDRGRELKLPITPGDRVPVTLRAALGESEAGEVHTFDITQTAGDGRVIGGARVIAVAVPEFLIC